MQKEDIKLSIVIQIITVVCKLDAYATLKGILNKITASNGVCVLHRLNFPLKIVIVTNIIYFYSRSVLFPIVLNLS